MPDNEDMPLLFRVIAGLGMAFFYGLIVWFFLQVGGK